MEIRDACTGQVIPFTLVPLLPGAIDELLAAEVIGDNVEMTGHFDHSDEMPSLAVHVMGIAGVDFVPSVSDLTLPSQEPVESSHSALPPGSICEQCFDQPATEILPAPWGGEMGVCLWCAAETHQKASPAYTDTISPVTPVTITQFSSDMRTWHALVTECPAGVRYIRNIVMYM